MSNDVELADMLESYPSAMTPQFQTLITAKHEFFELASDPNERLPIGRGKFYKHQLLTMRYLRAYDDLLLLDEAGTGKSCSVISFTEYTRAELNKFRNNPNTADRKAARFKRVIVLTKGKVQTAEFKNQLICKCSDGHYETKKVNEAVTEKAQKHNITSIIGAAGYQVNTFVKFTKNIDTNYPDSSYDNQLINDYEGTIFWIDEGQYLNIEESEAPKKKAQTKSARKPWNKDDTYRVLHRLFHLVPRCKHVISTATPMINEERDIISLMNLLLPLDGIIPEGYDFRDAPPNDLRVLFPNFNGDIKTIPKAQLAPYFRGQFPKNYDFTKATLEDLEPYFRGRVGYVRALDTGVQLVEQGDPINLEVFSEDRNESYMSQLILFTSRMSDFQSKSYERSINDRDTIYTSERQAANFVFPDGSWGGGETDQDKQRKKLIKQLTKKVDNQTANAQELQTLQNLSTSKVTRTDTGFKRYVKTQADTFTASDELKQSLDEASRNWPEILTHIQQYSCKMAEIVRLLYENAGNAFIYSYYLDGSGAIILALCLEAMGFERYNENSSIFMGVTENRVKPYCSGSEIEAGTRRIRENILPSIDSQGQLVRPYRYALISGKTTDPKVKSILETMNSYENRHSAYIKVLIVTSVGREGISVNNVLSIHLLGSEWNESNIYQATSRSIRTTSHDDLLAEERQRLQAAKLAGDVMADPAKAKLEVKIYKHAAVSNKNASVDIYMYQASEKKNRRIKRIMRILKQCAVTCQIHYKRNVRALDANNRLLSYHQTFDPNTVGVHTVDVDNTAVCDYESCIYECVDPEPGMEDFSTYDILYAEVMIDEAMDKIREMYRQYNVLTLDQIVNLINDQGQFRRKYIVLALERFVTQKIPLLDKFGYTSYLEEDNNSFYLNRNFPTNVNGEQAMALYSQGIIANEGEPLSAIVSRLESGYISELIDRLRSIPLDSPEFNAEIDALTIEGKATLLEDIVIDMLTHGESPFTQKILDRFKDVLFKVREPVTELNKVQNEIEQNKPRRGRKKKEGVKRRQKRIIPGQVTENTEDANAEEIYLHTLYSQATDQTAYNIMANRSKAEGRIRILKPSEIEDGWRDLTDIEKTIYNPLLQKAIFQKDAPLRRFGFFGSVAEDKKFRIHDVLNESEKAGTDIRSVNRGKICVTWHKPQLFDVMWHTKMPAPTGYFPGMTNDLDQLRKAILAKRSNHNAQELATWDLERLQYYYKWSYASNAKRPDICVAIEGHLRQIGAFI